MGVLIEGTWRDEELPEDFDAAGGFRIADSGVHDRITADGASGFGGQPGRYHLYVSHSCPFAHRTLILRVLKKLEYAITVSYALPAIQEQGWTFERSREFPECTPDAVNGFHYLHEAYVATNPRYTGRVSRTGAMGQEDGTDREQRLGRDHADAGLRAGARRRK